MVKEIKLIRISVPLVSQTVARSSGGLLYHRFWNQGHAKHLTSLSSEHILRVIEGLIALTKRLSCYAQLFGFIRNSRFRYERPVVQVLASMLDKIAKIISVITGSFAIVGALYAFFTKTDIGSWFWVRATVTGIIVLVLVIALYITVSNAEVSRTLKTGAINLLQKSPRLFALIAIVLAAFVAYRYIVPAKTKSIEGIIYYQTSPGRTPVSHVTVFVSQFPNLRSEPTSLDGKFRIDLIPASFQVTSLTAKYEGQDFRTDFSNTGDYAIIPFQTGAPATYRTIDTPWTPTSARLCSAGESQGGATVRRYLLRTHLPADHGKQRAFVTVELQDPRGAEFSSAYVISPLLSSQLYRDVVDPEKDEKISHTWAFTLTESGLDIELEICVGSPRSSPDLSHQLRAYY